MNNIVPFSFESHSVRTAMINHKLWFVAQDILNALDYAGSYKPATALRHVPEEWRGVHRIHTPGGGQDVIMLSEEGLYFFLGRSDKPKALPFQKWLAGEVVPSIRKTGSYEPKKGWQRPAAIDTAASLLRNGTFMMTVGQDGRIFLTQVRENEKFLDVSDPSDLSRLILCDMPESFLPRAAELLMKRALKIKQDDVGDLPVKEVQ